METWKQIPGWPYSVSDQGRLRTDRYQRILKGYVDKAGYVRVGLCQNYETRSCGLHELVLEVFVGSRPPGMESRHLDGNPANNRLKNLAWGTPKENHDDQYRHGTINQGERHGKAKLTREQVIQIRMDLAAGFSFRALSQRYGVHEKTIRDIETGKNWKWLT